MYNLAHNEDTPPGSPYLGRQQRGGEPVLPVPIARPGLSIDQLQGPQSSLRLPNLPPPLSARSQSKVPREVTAPPEDARPYLGHPYSSRLGASGT